MGYGDYNNSRIPAMGNQPRTEVSGQQWDRLMNPPLDLASPQYQQAQTENQNPYKSAGGGMQGVGSGVASAAPMTGPAAPWVAGAGLAVQGAGTVASIYGDYLAGQEAKARQRKLDVAAEQEDERQKRLGLSNLQGQRTQDVYNVGAEANRRLPAQQSAYGQYKRRVQ